MEIEILPLGQLQTNCYIVHHQKKGLIIDPSEEAPTINDTLKRLEIEPQAILLTHAHFDHIGALEEIRTTYNIPVYMHEAEKEWLSDASLNRSAAFIGNEVTASPPDHLISEGEITIADFNIEVRESPGHSPGGLLFIFHKQQWVVGGDSLFYESIGRTDLPGGSFEQLKESIQSKFFSLPDSYTVFPGHGRKTTIGHEKEFNPFVR